MEITMPETILHRVHEIAEKDSMSEGWGFLDMQMEHFDLNDEEE